jgi:flagellar motor switch protein FliN/FliY
MDAPIDRDGLLASADAALVLAEALERALGNQTILTVGQPRSTIAEVLGESDGRTVVLGFTSAAGTSGEIALTSTAQFATALEHAAADELLVSTCAPALEAAAGALAAAGDASFDLQRAIESDSSAFEPPIGATVVVVPILSATEPVACMSVVVLGDARHDDATAAGGGPATRGRAARVDAPDVLADVELGFTAELGRTRMTLRQLLSITPGSVIDLDRPVGTPVDVLVNGLPVARGEIVLMDEELAVRISEVLR